MMLALKHGNNMKGPFDNSSFQLFEISLSPIVKQTVNLIIIKQFLGQ